MAFTIVQSQAAASGVTGTPTTSLTWSPAPTNGNLLVVALTFRGNATVSEATAQGWIQAVGNIQNGTTAQTEIWYRVAGAGEGTTGPSFNTAAVLYQIVQAEVSGFTGTPTLDKTGSQIATASLTDVVSAASITAASEFVFAGCGNREGATTGITFSTSTAGGSATIGSPEPIQNVNAAKNGEGLRASWATSGGSGTSPSITFNLSATTNNNLTAGIATFQGVVAAAVAGLVSAAAFSESG